MRKFVVNVNGNSYQVEVEEIGAGESVQITSAPKAAPAAPVAKPEAAPAPVAKPEVVTEVKPKEE